MREILSFVMSIYDPMGFIAHLTIHGKILMQELHKEMSDWDDEIPDHLYEMWKHWLIIIKRATTIKIPRWMLAAHMQYFELHVFVDASEYAFAAVAYARILKGSGSTASIKITAAKSRVAPIRRLSIPRYELQAAVLGVRLMNTINQELRTKP